MAPNFPTTLSSHLNPVDVHHHNSAPVTAHCLQILDPLHRPLPRHPLTLSAVHFRVRRKVPGGLWALIPVRWTNCAVRLEEASRAPVIGRVGQPGVQARAAGQPTPRPPGALGSGLWGHSLADLRVGTPCLAPSSQCTPALSSVCMLDRSCAAISNRAKS